MPTNDKINLNTVNGGVSLPTPKKVTTSKTMDADAAKAYIAAAQADPAKIVTTDPVSAKVSIRDATPAERMKKAAELAAAKATAATTATGGASELKSLELACILGDTPVLPTPANTKPDKALLDSLINKLGSGTALNDQQIESAYSMVITASTDGSSTWGLLGKTDAEANKFMLLMLLLELGYQNRDMNSKMTEVGQKLREANTDMSNAMSEIEIRHRQMSATFNYMVKDMNSKVQGLKELNELIKTTRSSMALIDEDQAKKKVQAARVEQQKSSAEAQALLGPKGADAAAISLARKEYVAALSEHPTDSTKIDGKRAALQSAGGKQAVASANEEALAGAQLPAAQHKELRTYNADTRKALTALAGKLAQQQSEVDAAERQLYASSYTAELIQLRDKDEHMKPGEAETLAEAHAQAQLLRAQDPRKAQRYEELDRKQGWQMTEGEPAELARLKDELAPYVAMKGMEENLHALQKEETAYSRSPDPNAKIGGTDWQALSATVKAYNDATLAGNATRASATMQDISKTVLAGQARLDNVRTNMSPEEKQLTAQRNVLEARTTELAGRIGILNNKIGSLEARRELLNAQLANGILLKPEQRTAINKELGEIDSHLRGLKMERGVAEQGLAQANDAKDRIDGALQAARRSDPNRRPSAAQAKAINDASNTLRATDDAYFSAEARVKRNEADTKRFAQLSGIAARLLDIDDELKAAQAQMSSPDLSTRKKAQDQINTLAADKERNTLQRTQLLSESGLGANASASEIKAGELKAQLNLATSQSAFAEQRIIRSKAEGEFNLALHKIAMQGGNFTAMPTPPAQFGMPPQAKTYASAAEMYSDAMRASQQASAEYLQYHAGVSKMPPFPSPRTTAESFANDYEPLTVSVGSGVVTPITADEQKNPWGISEPARREAVLHKLSARALAKADIIAQQSDRVLTFGSLTGEHHWSAADANNFLAKRDASAAAVNEFIAVHQDQTFNASNLNVSKTPYPAATDMSSKATTTRAYYTAMREHELARLDGIANSYTPPKDVSEAKAQVMAMYGDDVEVKDKNGISHMIASGGLYAKASLATTKPDKIAANGEIFKTQVACKKATPPANRDEIKYNNKAGQNVPGESFFGAIGRNAGYLKNWADFAEGAAASISNIASSMEQMSQNFTGIARESMDKYSAVFADFREELARSSASTSMDWAKTLRLMQNTMKMSA